MSGGGVQHVAPLSCWFSFTVKTTWVLDLGDGVNVHGIITSSLSFPTIIV